MRTKNVWWNKGFKVIFIVIMYVQCSIRMFTVQAEGGDGGEENMHLCLTPFRISKVELKERGGIDYLSL